MSELLIIKQAVSRVNQSVSKVSWTITHDSPSLLTNLYPSKAEQLAMERALTPLSDLPEHQHMLIQEAAWKPITSKELQDCIDAQLCTARSKQGRNTRKLQATGFFCTVSFYDQATVLIGGFLQS